MEMCDNCTYNQQVLDRIKNEIPDSELTIELADMFKVSRRTISDVINYKTWKKVD